MNSNRNIADRWSAALSSFGWKDIQVSALPQAKHFWRSLVRRNDSSILFRKEFSILFSSALPLEHGHHPVILIWKLLTAWQGSERQTHTLVQQPSSCEQLAPSRHERQPNLGKELYNVHITLQAHLFWWLPERHYVFQTYCFLRHILGPEVSAMAIRILPWISTLCLQYAHLWYVWHVRNLKRFLWFPYFVLFQHIKYTQKIGPW